MLGTILYTAALYMGKLFLDTRR